MKDRRFWVMAAMLLPLAALFLFVLVRSGPMAPIPVTVTTVESRSISPALFGIGTLEARYTFRVGPTAAARVRSVEVDVGDRVRAGELLGEMDPVDLDSRVAAQEAAIRRASATRLSADAQVQEAAARQAYSASQAGRYEQLAREGISSQESVDASRQELLVAEAGLAAARSTLEAARQELERLREDLESQIRLRANLQLIAPADGLVIARHADPGSTVVAGLSVVELIAPDSLWIQTRFEQLLSSGLAAGLPARIVLRSQGGRALQGSVLRVEPTADSVTEEMLAKVVLDSLPAKLPPVGELAEVTVALPALPASAAVPNASLQRVQGRSGVWVVERGKLRFAAVEPGANDLEGWVQILGGVEVGERVIVHSRSALSARSRIKVVDRLPGVTP